MLHSPTPEAYNRIFLRCISMLGQTLSEARANACGTIFGLFKTLELLSLLGRPQASGGASPLLFEAGLMFCRNTAGSQKVLPARCSDGPVPTAIRLCAHAAPFARTVIVDHSLL